MSPVPAAAIEVERLSHTYARREGEVEVLCGVTFAVEEAGYASLVGPSGSGKTTLLSLIGGLEHPQSGRVIVAGHDLSLLAGDRLAEFRRSTVGFVFQHFGLLEALTALENLELTLTFSGVDRTERRRRAAELLERVGLADRTNHRPFELSGGERQRVAIARALSNRPQLILADEPTGNLDDDTATAVVRLLESLPSDYGCTLFVVTHNRSLAARADVRLALASGGVTTESGAIEGTGASSTVRRAVIGGSSEP
jgi:putative ABC transport system ATP-binding protein